MNPFAENGPLSLGVWLLPYSRHQGKRAFSLKGLAMEIPYGYCHCGCGQKTKLAPQTKTKDNVFKGEPNQFINGHQYYLMQKYGKDHHGWKGGKIITGRQCRIRKPQHPRSDSKGYVAEHLLVAESVLGHPLPPKAVIHHINLDPFDNSRSNLVICENDGYHQILHARKRALAACGHAHWKRCSICHQYDDPVNMRRRKTRRSYHHQTCYREYKRELWRNRPK